MLKQISIKNYALIDRLETTFEAGFSVLTGETGAGKSIILGALSLILGQRADQQAVKDKNEKCIIEGIFDISRHDLRFFFDENNLDYQPELTILRREILPSGKSRAFVNDTPVMLSQMKPLADLLIDIHSQNSIILLQDAAFQLDVLDNFCDNTHELRNYKSLYHSYRIKVQQIETLRKAEEQARAEQDFYKYQYDEIVKAAPAIGEQQEIEEELGMLRHAEEIKSRLFNVSQLLEADNGMEQIFGEILTEYKPLRSYSAELNAIGERFESNRLELMDLAAEVHKIGERVEVNPDRAEALTGRVNLIYQLQHKHKVADVESLLAVRDEYRRKMDDYDSLADKITAGEKELELMMKKLQEQAAALSVSRKKGSAALEARIIETISQLGMPDARLKVEITPARQLTENGMDTVVFLFNANKGGTLMEMSKIASGGELSRLMLSIKSLIAFKNFIPTIIFDEIDSGVSGEVAGKMAAIMQSMGGRMQVITITHLPQIAARGATHYYVSKRTTGQTTQTTISRLSQQQRVTEIAKMLS
ncbi:DNA repair protein RecN, partial [Candidatus Falkowbacteria bacterium]|nr:DNA repair protein RecN [Candidatus Falkowbacteria bacterium]